MCQLCLCWCKITELCVTRFWLTRFVSNASGWTEQLCVVLGIVKTTGFMCLFVGRGIVIGA